MSNTGMRTFSIRRDPLACVRHFYPELIRVSRGGDADHAALRQLRHSMLDAVFNKRLNNHWRNPLDSERRRNIHFDPKTFFEPDFFTSEIVLDGGDLVTQRYFTLLARLQRIPHEIGESCHDILRFDRILENHPTQIVQPVEKEVRVDLRQKRPQFRVLCRNLQFELLAFCPTALLDVMYCNIKNGPEQVRHDPRHDECSNLRLKRVVTRDPETDQDGTGRRENAGEGRTDEQP